MKTYDLSVLSTREKLSLVKRPASGGPAFRTAAATVCRAVQTEGDAALKRYTRQFDGVDVNELRVPAREIESARDRLSPDLLEAIRTAIRNVTAFHRGQGFTPVWVESVPGVLCWREVRPIGRVGLYVPAGSSPLPSTLVMLGVPALLAGCDEVVVCSPPDVNGAIHAAILATAHELGIREVYRVGGAQAIGAMAFGTESIPRVDKIFGPGNAYVTAAKQYVSIDPDGAAIDFAAGPSELLIIADASADPVLLAADLLSQAEHDPSSQVVLVCTNPGTPDRVADLIRARVGDAPRKEIIERSLLNSYIVVASSLEEAVAFSNLYAPEHLQLNISSPQDCVPSIRNAGSVFLGAWSPVTAGDYASGTNHTLPTAGAAIAGSGVSVESFTKTTSFQTLTRSGLSSLSPTLLTLSRAEGLEEHARAVEVRLS